MSTSTPKTNSGGNTPTCINRGCDSSPLPGEAHCGPCVDKTMQQLLELFGKAQQKLRSNPFKGEELRPCPLCGGEQTTFSDEASEREYRISGMCQACQDGYFK